MGRYRLEELLGQGGMGAVFAATHLKLERPVAVKVLHRDLLRDPTLTQRFFAEARAAASVDQPGVVDVLDLDVDPERGPFLVMERLRGESLAEILARGALAPERAVSIIADVLDVLAAVHAKGIVHRDLKPPNVFLHRTESGEEVVKVVDFGIAQIAQARLTITGQVIGTPRWMAPEQARGDEIDHRADLYSTALLLHCALSGKPPFADYPSSALVHALSQGHPSLRGMVDGLPEALYQVVDRAMASDPSVRFASAAEMAAALRAIPFHAAPIPPTMVSRPVAPRSTSPRWLWIALAGVLLLVALVAAGAIAWMTTEDEVAPSIGVAIQSQGECAPPVQGPWATAAHRSTILWTSSQGSLAVRAPMGASRLSVGDARVDVVVGEFRGYAGELEVRRFDPYQRNADVTFHSLLLRAPDGRGCTLSGTVRVE